MGTQLYNTGQQKRKKRENNTINLTYKRGAFNVASSVC